MPIHHPLGFKQHPLEDAGILLYDISRYIFPVFDVFRLDFKGVLHVKNSHTSLDHTPPKKVALLGRRWAHEHENAPVQEARCFFDSCALGKR